MPAIGVDFESMAGFGGAGARPSMPDIGAAFESVRNNLPDRMTFGKRLSEMLAGGIFGSILKNAAKASLFAAGFNAWTVAIAGGAIGGAIVGGGIEYIKQVWQNTRSELPPEADTARKRLLERMKPNDLRKLGKAVVRGALFGAIGGAVAEAVSEYFHPDVSTLHASAPDNVSADSTHSPIIDHHIEHTGAENYHVNTDPSHASPVIDHHPENAEAPTSHTENISNAHGSATGSPVSPETAVHGLGNIPPEYTLQQGDNPWSVMEKTLAKILGRRPTPGEILKATKSFVLANKISVPAWGINGSDFISDRALHVGGKLFFTSDVNSVIADILKAKT